jgi:Uma2 family endonuclease
VSDLDHESDQFNLGEDLNNYRIPDAGLHRQRSGAWLHTAALAAEILSPGDESWDKLAFYAAHRVDEVVIVDPVQRVAHWLALDEHGEYQPVERSAVIDLGPAQLVERLDWP